MPSYSGPLKIGSVYVYHGVNSPTDVLRVYDKQTNLYKRYLDYEEKVVCESILGTCAICHTLDGGWTMLDYVYFRWFDEI